MVPGKRGEFWGGVEIGGTESTGLNPRVGEKMGRTELDGVASLGARKQVPRRRKTITRGSGQELKEEIQSQGNCG